MGFLTRKKSALKIILSGSLGEPLGMIPSNPAERPFVGGVCLCNHLDWLVLCSCYHLACVTTAYISMG